MTAFNPATAAVALAAALSFSGPAAASTWIEHDAGDGLGSAEVTTGVASLDGIDGFLSVSTPVDGLPTYQVDLYKITIDDYIGFSAKTVSATPDDTALFLFDAGGHGVYMNDDNLSNLLSTLPGGISYGPSTSGTYYLGVGIGGVVAQDDALGSVFLGGDFRSVLAGAPGAGTLASWSQSFPTFEESGLAYSVALTGAAFAAAPVPEPTSALLLAAGLVGLAGWRRRQATRPGHAA